MIHYSGEELNTPVVSVIFPTDSSDSATTRTTTSTKSKLGYINNFNGDFNAQIKHMYFVHVLKYSLIQY